MLRFGPKGLRREMMYGLFPVILLPVLSGFYVFLSLGHATELTRTVPGVGFVCENFPSCLNLLKSDDPKIVGGAIATLGELKDPRAVPDLIRIVQQHNFGEDVYHYEDTPTSHTVVTAIRALGAIGDRQALPVLIDFTKKEEYIQYRVLAAEMIRMIGIDREDIPSLLTLLNDPHSSIRFVIFETIRFADDPVSKSYTMRLINYVPRVDMIDDTINTFPHMEAIGVPIYPGTDYLFYASVSDSWIMREHARQLMKVHWLHTFLTKDSLEDVKEYYENILKRKPVELSRLGRQYIPMSEEELERDFIGQGFSFVIRKKEHRSLSAPIVVISLYEDKVLNGTAITVSAPK